MKIDIEHLESLSRLRLSESEREKAAHEIGRILDYVSIIERSDYSDTPGDTPLSAELLREDIPTIVYSREDMLKNAPSRKDGMFKVPRTVE